jgi:hypothetical protein
MAKKKTSITAIAGCRSCGYFSGNGNCVKYGFSTKELNEDPYFTSENSGMFKISRMDGCPSHMLRGQYEAIRREKYSLSEVKMIERDGGKKARTRIVSGEEAKAISRRLTEHQVSHVQQGENLLVPKFAWDLTV